MLVQLAVAIKDLCTSLSTYIGDNMEKTMDEFIRSHLASSAYSVKVRWNYYLPKNPCTVYLCYLAKLWGSTEGRKFGP